MATPGYRHRYLFLGHSFARKLKTYTNMSPALRNLGFDRDYCNIVGTRDRHNLTFLRHISRWITRFSASIATVDITCLCVGSNDIVEAYQHRPHQLAHDILQAAEDLLTAGSKRVIIIPILFREGLAAVPRPQQAQATAEDILQAELDYIDQVMEVNRLLKIGCDLHPKMSFHPLRGLKQNWKSTLADGTHLTWTAMRTFFNAVRSAFIIEKNRLY